MQAALLRQVWNFKNLFCIQVWNHSKGSVFWVVRMKMVQVIGKRVRPVPIIIPEELLTAMDVLVETRKQCGVDDNNGYFFAIPMSQSHLHFWPTMQRVSQQARLKRPELVTSTRIRKHLATMAQVGVSVIPFLIIYLLTMLLTRFILYTFFISPMSDDLTDRKMSNKAQIQMLVVYTCWVVESLLLLRSKWPWIPYDHLDIFCTARKNVCICLTGYLRINAHIHLNVCRRINLFFPADWSDPDTAGLAIESSWSWPQYSQIFISTAHISYWTNKSRQSSDVSRFWRLQKLPWKIIKCHTKSATRLALFTFCALYLHFIFVNVYLGGSILGPLYFNCSVLVPEQIAVSLHIFVCQPVWHPYKSFHSAFSFITCEFVGWVTNG